MSAAGIPASKLEEHLIELPEGWGKRPELVDVLDRLLPVAGIFAQELYDGIAKAGFTFEWNPAGYEMLVVWEDREDEEGYAEDGEAPRTWLVCPVCGDDSGLGYQENVLAWRRGAAKNEDGLLTLDSHAEYGDGDDNPGIVCHDHTYALPLWLPDGWEMDWC